MSRRRLAVTGWQLLAVAGVLAAVVVIALAARPAAPPNCVRATPPSGIHTLIVIKRCQNTDIVWTP